MLENKWLALGASHLLVSLLCNGVLQRKMTQNDKFDKQILQDALIMSNKNDTK